MEHIKGFDSFDKIEEEKKWIKDAIKKPGALRNKLGKKKGEKITKTEIRDEISKLRSKDKDKGKEGIQLGKKDATKLKQLNLAKTLKGFKENVENEIISGGETSPKLFIIGYGLAGGFGGASNYEVIEADTQDEADKYAWEMACEEYESYVGSNGLRELCEIMEEDEVDEEEAEEIFNEEREGWLDYSARPYSKEYEKKVMGHHYNNNYKKITDKL